MDLSEEERNCADYKNKMIKAWLNAAQKILNKVRYCMAHGPIF